MKKQGFTLIELLIVVAIIAILAAIAIPNFLQAQTRAKVSRAQADMRSLATGLESYYVDWNDYPPDFTHGVGGTTVEEYPYRHFQRLQPITTPVAYTTSLPLDPFHRPEENDGVQNVYVYAGKHLPEDFDQFKIVAVQVGLDVDQHHQLFWYLRSVGPDGQSVPFGSGSLSDAKVELYDPTNGTISYGEIIRTNLGQMN